MIFPWAESILGAIAAGVGGGFLLWFGCRALRGFIIDRQSGRPTIHGALVIYPLAAIAVGGIFVVLAIRLVCAMIETAQTFGGMI